MPRHLPRAFDTLRAMRTVLLVLMLGCSLAGGLKAAPPQCDAPDRQKNLTMENCHRAEENCDSLAREYLREPSDKWNGCAWPALILFSSSIIFPGTSPYNSTQVTLVPSYLDSERMDITVTVEQPDHTYKGQTFKDVPIIIRDNIPQATIDFPTPKYLVELAFFPVPTVEATEKGGKKEASHSYK